MKMAMVAVVVAAAMLVGCGAIDSPDFPIKRNLSWFDYVGGRSVKEACAPNSSQHMRFVYNGNYDEQIRTYDLTEQPNGHGITLSAWARGDGNLSDGIKFPNLLSPWQGVRVDTMLNRAVLGDLRRLLKEDGFEGFRPVGLQLPSNEYYWIVTACLDGQFYSNAWLYPSQRYQGLTFPEKLLTFDRTSITFREAAAAKRHEGYPRSRFDSRNAVNHSFQLELGANGFVGARDVF